MLTEAELLQKKIDKEGTLRLWKHSELYCLIWRHPHLLHLCGYVGVTKENPLYGKGYDHVDVEVHGGLTWNGQRDWFKLEDVWWFGFDCAHYGDLTPYNVTKYFGAISSGEEYRDMEYVESEVNNLAEQIFSLKELTNK